MSAGDEVRQLSRDMERDAKRLAELVQMLCDQLEAAHAETGRELEASNSLRARIAELERQVAALTPGRGLAEYLAAMSERDAFRERVAELEAQAAQPPECVVKLLAATKYRSDETGMLGAAVAKHYGLELPLTPPPAPDGHEWQPVDAEHPLTAEDHRRMVRQRNGEEWMMAWGGSDRYPARVGRNTCTAHGIHFGADPNPLDIVAVLRPKPAPEPPKPQPGEVWESVREDDGDAKRVGEIISTRGGLAYLMDADGDGLRRVAFAITGDRLTCDNEWLDRKLTRRVS